MPVLVLSQYVEPLYAQELLADRAGGVWNMLSGAVQALVVRDLLDTATAHRLLAPVVAALGPAWLG